jgi:hypothetical protein
MPPRIPRSVSRSALACLALAGACVVASVDYVDDFNAESYVADPETWGRDRTRSDLERPPGAGELKVGVATRTIDGPVGASMAGYGGRGKGRQTHWNYLLKGTAGFYGLQELKAVVLEVGSERMAFVKSPLMSSESYLTDAIARQLEKNHGLDFRGRVITVAGHSHHSTARYWPLPELLGAVGADSFDPEIAEVIAGRFAEAIAEGWARREPAEWGWAHVENWDPDDEVYRDRREVNDAKYGKDPRLTVMGFRRKSDAAPLAVVFNFPIHGTAFGADNDLFTEDAPGYVEHKFEEAFFAKYGKPVHGLFAQSAGGDASPAGDSLGHPTLARLERLGAAAAPRILAVYESLGWSSDTELAIRSQRIELAHERMYAGRPWATEFANDKNEPFTWGAWQCFGEKGSTTMEGNPKYCVDMETFFALLDSKVPHEGAHQVFLTTARLGDLWMTTVPGEPTYSLVKYAREKAAERTWRGQPVELMVLGYSQDHLLYFAAPDDWYLGEYEATMSLWGPGGGAFIVDEQLAVMDAMIAGKNGPILFQESPSLAPVPEWQPRERERSVAAGEIVEQPAATVARTQSARFAANCGDPALGSPRLKVQRRDAEAFVDLPSRIGFPDRVYDNGRYDIVSAYNPNPAPADNASESERTHTWRFYWQVPSDWPAGSYRFQLACKVVRSGAASAAPEELALASTPFEVTAASGTTLDIALEGRSLSLAMRVPGVPLELTDGVGQAKWASAGYRLLDPDVRHEEPALVRADLKAELLDAEGAVLAAVDAPFAADARQNKAQLPSDPPAGATSLRVWLASDHTPAKVTVALAR